MENEPQKTAFAYLDGDPPRVAFMGTVCETPKGASFTVSRPLPKRGIAMTRAKRVFVVIGFIAAIFLGRAFAEVSSVSRETYGSISFFAGALMVFIATRF